MLGRLPKCSHWWVATLLTAEIAGRAEKTKTKKEGTNLLGARDVLGGENLVGSYS
jgi:hypothetical protein